VKAWRRSRPATGPEATLLRRTGRRLGLQAAAIVSVIVFTLTATAVLVVLHSQRNEANTLLDQAIARAIDVVDPPAGVWLIAQTPDGMIMATPELPAGLRDLTALRRAAATGIPEAFDRHLDGRDYRVRTVRRGDGVTLEAILDLSANQAEQNRLVTAMLLTGGLGLLLAAAAGAWLGARATRPLSTALALQRRFVSDASHELRTPLTLLSTRAQLLRRRLQSGASGPGVLVEADQVVDHAQRLAAILDDLLLAADPTSARPQIEIDLTTLAADVVAEAEPDRLNSPIQIIGPPAPDHTADHDTVARGSPIALRRAITALVDNAVRHANNTVRVSVHRAHQHVLIEVADDGPGVDPELATRLFERFVSTHVPGAEGRRHYGLGLALVRETVASHGGTVELAEPDRPGAVFRITLPSAHRAAR
jgi:two-component system, OmpR family, sensor kinase